ncbi:MAG: hypothetical protein LBN35_00405 [Clostridiales Family XIII bacterium]|jgi:nitrogenase molybdenum-iron protein beta chain|nr:hypothetical protein [Clostridiales Family XIII bacterium]
MSGEQFVERPRNFCALGGALQTVAAIKGAIPILHASIGCGGSIYWNQLGSTGYLGAGYCGGLAVPSSNIGERDVVFGGLDRLEEQVKSTFKLMDGELYVILTGCTADIIGDDIQAVVRQYSNEEHVLIGAETGGFNGDGYAGYDIVLAALAKDYIEKKPQKDPRKVNLFGIVPGQDAFWRGNLAKLRALLEKLGLTVNSFFTEDDTLQSIRESGDAALSVIVSDFYGARAAAAFENEHEIPVCAGPLPIGPTATADFLYAVADSLQLPGNKVDVVLREEEKSYFHYVERVADAFNDLDWQRYAVVVGDVNYAPAITKFLADDLGWLPELMVVTNETDDAGKEKIQNRIDELESHYPTNIAYETDPTEVKTHFWKYIQRRSDSMYADDFSPGFVVGSHLEREFATDIGADHLTVSFPVGNRVVLNRGYAGIDGSLSLVEDLLSALALQR